MTQEHLHPDPGLDPGHRGLVDPRSTRPGVAGHPLPRVDQKRRIVDEVEQVTEPAGRVFSRPTMQLDLHPPYRVVRRTGVRPLHSAGVRRCIFGHCILSVTDTLPPFPMYRALPGSEYYDGSAPPAPSAGIAPIHKPVPSGRGWAVERSRAVPTFTVVRSTS